MATGLPLQASVLRAPSPDAVCSCQHPVHCDCECHGRHCDPTRHECHADYLPDEGGLALWGCLDCTPGATAPHFLGCELIGWNVPVPVPRSPRSGAFSLHSTWTRTDTYV